MRRPGWYLGLLAVTALWACAPGPRVVTRDDGTARIFGGERVVGNYVSPAAYAHYMAAQMATQQGANAEAADELSQAIAADSTSPYLRTRYGEELLALGRVDEAREAFEQALRYDGGYAEAHVDLGRIALRLGNVAGAESSFRKAIEVDRSSESAYLALAALYRDRGEAARVDGVHRMMAERLPDAPATHRELARAAMGRGDLRGASVELEKTLALSPGDLEARIELGRLLFAQGSISSAERELRLAYERSYHDARIAELLISVETAAGRSDQADALLDALDGSGGPRERRLSLGRLLLSRQRFERAVAIADELLKGADPSSSSSVSSSARLLRAAGLAGQKKTDEAQDELRRVPAGGPEWPRAQLQLGQLLVGGGKVKEAIAQLGEVAAQVEGKPESDLIVSLLAEARERSGDVAGSQRLLEGALKAHPSSDALDYALGSLLDRAGHADRAVALVQAILVRSPDNAEALNFVGWSYADRGIKLKEAQSFLERAHALRPSSGEIADSLGWLYYKLDRVDDSIRLLETAERLAPTSPDVSHHLGDAYWKARDRLRAVGAYRRALAHNPDAKIRQAVEERLLHLEEGRVGAR